MARSITRMGLALAALSAVGLCFASSGCELVTSFDRAKVDAASVAPMPVQSADAGTSALPNAAAGAGGAPAGVIAGASAGAGGFAATPPPAGNSAPGLPMAPMDAGMDAQVDPVAPTPDAGDEPDAG